MVSKFRGTDNRSRKIQNCFEPYALNRIIHLTRGRRQILCSLLLVHATLEIFRSCRVIVKSESLPEIISPLGYTAPLSPLLRQNLLAPSSKARQGSLPIVGKVATVRHVDLRNSLSFLLIYTPDISVSRTSYLLRRLFAKPGPTYVSLPCVVSKLLSRLSDHISLSILHISTLAAFDIHELNE